MDFSSIGVVIDEDAGLDPARLQQLLQEKRHARPGEQRVMLLRALSEEQERLSYGEIHALPWAGAAMTVQRLRNALRAGHVHSLDQIRAWGPREILPLPMIGQRTFAILCAALEWDFRLAMLFAQTDTAPPSFAPSALRSLRDEQLISALEERGFEVRPRALAAPHATDSERGGALDHFIVSATQIRDARFRLVAFSLDDPRDPALARYTYIATAFPEISLHARARAGRLIYASFRVLRRMCSGDAGEMAALVSRHRASMADWTAVHVR